MSFIPTPNCVRTSIIYDYAGQQVINTLWAQRDAPWTQAQRDDLNAAIQNWWSGTGKANFVAALSLRQVTTVNQDASNSPSSTLIVSPIIPGSAAGAGTANNVALCATLRTAARGRSYRGRMYFAAFPPTGVQDTITATTNMLASLATIINALNTAITALGAVWVVVSKWSNKVQRGAGLPTPVTAFSIDQYWDSQRRRLGLRGV